MQKKILPLLCLLVAAAWAEDPEKIFVSPPASARPGVWWHWMGCNVSREGISRDLEAFKAAGIGGATIFGMSDVCTPWAGHIDNSPNDGLLAFTEPWWKLVRHAVAEAKRLGLDVGIHNCPGYTSSGGPWITPELSMQEVCISRTVVDGGVRFLGAVSRPQVDPRAVMYFPVINKETGLVEKPVIEGRKTFYRDIAVLALPADRVVAKEQVVNLTGRLHDDGQLDWTPSPGRWAIYRIGTTTMGSMTQPNQWEIRGLECDKMSAEATEFHIQHVLADLKRNLGDLVGTGLQHVLFDSYEAGTPSWTPKMSQEFARRRGYDLTPFLATFAGRVIGSDRETQRFKEDFARTIADLYRDNYFATVSRLLHEAELRFVCEPYGGPWHTGEVTPYVDRVMTEFWSGPSFRDGGPGGMMNAGDGKLHNILEAEAFTGAPENSMWMETPAGLKPAGDGAFCAGINRLVFHSATHQPWDDRYRPGNSMGRWGTHFSRWQTWWEPGRAWIAYLQRCQALLQWGKAAPGDFAIESGLALRGIHRQSDDADVFFVVNPSATAGSAAAVFKVSGRQPELWDPVTGVMRDLPEFEDRGKGIAVPLDFAPAQSFFVVFRKKSPGDRVPRSGRNFPQRKPVQEIAGAWDVTFDPKWGGPDRPVTFAVLEDWTKRPEAGVKYYSGTATYRKIFNAAEVSAMRRPMPGTPAGDASTATGVSGFTQGSTAAGAPGLPGDPFRQYSPVDLRPRASGEPKARPLTSTSDPRYLTPQMYLDLGVVQHLARVKLNGRDLGVVWCAPWGVTIPGNLLREKGNELEIEITNVWANRLIGDEQEPPDCEWRPGHMGPGNYLKRFPDWFVKGQPRPSKGRFGFVIWNYFHKDSSLAPSGLRGPVRVLIEDWSAGGSAR